MDYPCASVATGMGHVRGMVIFNLEFVEETSGFQPVEVGRTPEGVQRG